MSNRFTIWTVGLAAVALMASACSDGGGTTNGSVLKNRFANQASLNYTTKAGLKVARSCDEALSLYREMATSRMLMRLEQQRRWQVEYTQGYDSTDSTGSMNADAGSTSAAESSDSSAGSSAPKDYSETNTQVEGVDEADLVKTDGTKLFTLMGKDLVIVKSWPIADAGELGRVTLDAQGHALYLRGTDVVVLSATSRHQLENDTSDNYYYGYGWQPITLVTIIDVSNPAQPKITDRMAYEGYSVSTRRIDNRLYLVQRSSYNWDGLEYWADVPYGAPEQEINEAFDALAAKNTKIIADRTLADFVPWYAELSPEGALGEKSPITACENTYYPSVFSGEGSLTTVTVDLDSTAKAPTGATVLGDWGTVYASKEALYLAATNWSWWWWWGDAADDHKILTHIHKFAFDDETGAATYTASGSVEGYVLNQFSMDEFEGSLRVATTTASNGWWNDETSESAVTVLNQSGASLETVGHVGGLGKGERIFSVRFVGEKGYVVTFRQVDPLYVLDLRNPYQPKVSGELKIPGFSRYLHPIDGDHLLTIGRDATDEGQVLGLSFQIFDVSDPAAPSLAHKTVVDSYQWGWSEAEYDHHAFTYFAARGLLAVPVSGWVYEDEESYYGGSYQSELRIFKVSTDTGVTTLGEVSHLDMLGDLKEDGCYWNYGWQAQVRRGVFIEDYIFSVSSLGVKVHDTKALSSGSLAEMSLLDGSTNIDNYCW